MLGGDSPLQGPRPGLRSTELLEVLKERRHARPFRKSYLRVRAKVNSFVPAQTYIPLSCPRNLHHKASFHIRLRRFNVADGLRAEQSYVFNKGTLFELLLSKWEPKDVRERRPSFAEAEKLSVDVFPNSLLRNVVFSIYLLLFPGSFHCNAHLPSQAFKTIGFISKT